MIIIFDWDGTLCDSVESIVEAMQIAATELGYAPPAASAVRDIVGLGLDEAIAVMMPQLDTPARAELAAAYSRHYVALTQAPAPLFEGALDTLQMLRDRGMELAVATGKSRRGLDRVLSGLGMSGFFEITRCADETRSKPHPQMLREILEQRGKRPQEGVMVGDTEYDLAMAQALAMPAVGVSYGVHSPERLSRCEPMAIIDRLATLPSLIPGP